MGNGIGRMAFLFTQVWRLLNRIKGPLHNTMKILFVMNPTSGRNSNDAAILAIHAVAVEKNLDFKFRYTTGEDDDTAIQRDLEWYQPDCVVACGGDGTIQSVAASLIGKTISLGILPLGSANGLAKSLEIPQDTAEALALIAEAPRTRPLDLLRVNDKHLCVHLGDIGINALLVKNYTESGDKGMIGYAKHLLTAIQQTDLMHYTITTPSGTCEKEGYMLAFANAHKYGTGVHISQGSVSDGKFEICNVQQVDLESAIKAGLTALNVFVDKDMFSDVISCTRAHIKIDKNNHLQIDGEYIGETNELTIEIIPAAINVVVP